jgi:hypothetical protein
MAVLLAVAVVLPLQALVEQVIMVGLEERVLHLHFLAHLSLMLVVVVGLGIAVPEVRAELEVLAVVEQVVEVARLMALLVLLTQAVVAAVEEKVEVLAALAAAV